MHGKSFTKDSTNLVPWKTRQKVLRNIVCLHFWRVSLVWSYLALENQIKICIKTYHQLRLMFCSHNGFVNKLPILNRCKCSCREPFSNIHYSFQSAYNATESCKSIYAHRRFPQRCRFVHLRTFFHVFHKDSRPCTNWSTNGCILQAIITQISYCFTCFSISMRNTDFRFVTLEGWRKVWIWSKWKIDEVMQSWMHKTTCSINFRKYSCTWIVIWSICGLSIYAKEGKYWYTSTKLCSYHSLKYIPRYICNGYDIITGWQTETHPPPLFVCIFIE